LRVFESFTRFFSVADVKVLVLHQADLWSCLYWGWGFELRFGR